MCGGRSRTERLAQRLGVLDPRPGAGLPGPNRERGGGGRGDRRGRGAWATFPRSLGGRPRNWRRCHPLRRRASDSLRSCRLAFCVPPPRRRDGCVLLKRKKVVVPTQSLYDELLRTNALLHNRSPEARKNRLFHIPVFQGLDPNQLLSLVALRLRHVRTVGYLPRPNFSLHIRVLRQHGRYVAAAR